MHTKASRSWCGFAVLLVGAITWFSNLPAVGADNPPWPPLVSVLALDPDAAEQGSDTATFLVVRLGAANTALTVGYELGGEAANGTDYQTLSGTVTIPEGAYFAPVTVTPVDDYAVEGVESVVLALQQPPTWPPPYIVTWPSVALAEIADNDREPTNHPPIVNITSPPDGGIFEEGDDLPLVARGFDRDGRVLTVEFFNGTNSLGIVTNRALNASVNADLESRGGAHPLFDVSADAMLDVDVTVDKIPRGQLFRLVWSNAPPGHHVLTALATDNDGATKRSEAVEITVLVEPPTPLVWVSTIDPVGAEPTPNSNRLDTATFAIHRKGPTNESLVVYYRLGGTASNGVDYVELPHRAEIPSGSRGVKVVVEPLDDLLVEGPEGVVLTLLPSPVADAAVALPGDYRIGRADTARAIIRDNDVPPNEAPLVRLVQPRDGEVFLAPADIRLVALARDADGFIRTVEFFEGTNSLGIVTNLPSVDSAARPAYSLMWSNVPPGRYQLSAVATDNNGAMTESKPFEIRVVPRVIPPEVNITTVDRSATEPGIPAVIDFAAFSVTRTGNTNRPLHVYYSIHGTALNGIDYQLLTGRVTIPAGASSNRIIVNALHDLLVEGTESVVLKLQPHPILASDNLPEWWYRIGSNDVARAFILDNDEPPANLPPKVALVQPEDGDVFVAPADIRLIARAHDSDGWVRTVEFFAGTNSLGIVTNPPPTNAEFDDRLPEYLFTLKWENVPYGAYALTAVATDQRGASTRSDVVRIRVVPPRPPVLTIYATDPYASEGYWMETLPEPTALDANRPIPFPIRRSATFTVFRHGDTSKDLLVRYKLDGSAENGVDYEKLSGEVKLPAGETRALIVVHPIDDNLTEKTETVVAKLVAPVCIAVYPPPLDCYVVGDPDEGKALIFDNDRNQAPRLEIAHPSNGDVFRAHSDITIEVVTRDPDGWVPTVEFFANGEKIGEQTIYFIVAPPPGQVQKFSMIWSNVSVGEYVLTARARDDQGALALSDPVKIFVKPVPSLPVITIEAVDAIATEPNPFTDGLPDTAKFRVTRRGGDSSQSLPVHYRIGGTASNGLDYVQISGEVIIPAGSEHAPIEITPLDDNLHEGTEAIILSLVQPPCVTSNVVSADCYLVGQPSRAIAYLRDNDSPPNRPPTVAIVSPANGSVYCAPVDLRLIAAAHDSDGWVTTVEFFDGTNSLGVANDEVTILDTTLDRLPEVGTDVVTGNSLQRPFSLTWSNVPPGRHVLTAVATDNTGNTTRSREVEMFVREQTELPLVNIMTMDAIAREATTNTAAFRVRRTGSTNEALVVHYSIHGTANNGGDYLSIPGSITIPAGRRNARVVITPINDALAERAETVILHLVAPPSGLDTYELGRLRVAAAVILDNDSNLDGPELFVDGSMYLRLGQTAGTQLRVEASVDLKSWEAVGSFSTHAEANSFIDAERLDYTQRFFRLVPEYGASDDDE